MKIYDTDYSEEPAQDGDRLKVGIAEWAVTTDGVDLTTSGLGSCLGVALHDPSAGIAGLVHVMLPGAAAMADGKAAKFADSGTTHLVEEMVDSGADVDDIEAKLAGGSDMLDFTEGGAGIGERNVERVREALAEFDIPVVGDEVGGDHGGSIRLESDSGDLVIKSANTMEQRL